MNGWRQTDGQMATVSNKQCKKISTNGKEAGVCLGALPRTGDGLKLFIVLQTAETKARLPPPSANDPLKSFPEQVWGFVSNPPPILSILSCEPRPVLAQGFLYFANTHDE